MPFMKKINIIYECNAINDPDSPLYSVIGRVLIRTNTLSDIIKEAVYLISVMAHNPEANVQRSKESSINIILDMYNPFIINESIKLQRSDIGVLLDYFIASMSIGVGEAYDMASVDAIAINYKDGSFAISGNCYDIN